MDYKREKTILGARIKLITEATEFRMTLWINGFGLSDARTEEEITPLISFFNLEDIEEIGDVVRIKFRIYPNGTKYYNVEINPFLRTFIYQEKKYSTNDFYETIISKENE